MLPVLLAIAIAAPDDFYPNDSDQLVSYGDLPHVEGRTGHILVNTDQPEALAALDEVLDIFHIRHDVYRVTPATGVDDLALSRQLHDREDVRWAHPNLLVRLTTQADPTDPWFPSQWHLENTGQRGTVGVDINASLAWTFTGGAGQRIAIVDSGVQVDHPDLVVINGHDYLDNDDDSSPGTGDEGPHGTACAGIAAGRGNNGVGVAGVAYDAEIYAIRLIGGYTALEVLLDVFGEAVDNGATVISNSWGFGTTCYDFPTYGVFSDMGAIAEGGRNGLGTIVTFAAGNGACNIDGDGMLAVNTFVVVSAIESSDDLASYSSFGTSVDIGAPTSLLTTDMDPGGYGSYDGDGAYADGFSGTSAATPVVAGVAALMMAANDRLTAGNVRDVLCATATKNDVADGAYDENGRSIYYGCGRVDAGAAVAAVAASAPSTPVQTLLMDPSYDGRLVLAWEPATDPDNDILGYTVLWWTLHPETPHIIETTDTWVDIGDRKTVKVGDVVGWQVSARDTWGSGPLSVVGTTTLTALPEAPVIAQPTSYPEAESSNCAHAPATPWALLALTFLRRALRRRL